MMMMMMKAQAFQKPLADNYPITEPDAPHGLADAVCCHRSLADDEDECSEKRRQKRGSRHSMQLHTDDTSASPDQLAASDDAWGWPARCLTVIVKRNTVSRSITSCCRKCSVTICRRSEPRVMQSYHIDCETYCRTRLQLFMPQTRRKVNI